MKTGHRNCVRITALDYETIGPHFTQPNLTLCHLVTTPMFKLAAITIRYDYTQDSVCELCLDRRSDLTESGTVLWEDESIA